MRAITAIVLSICLGVTGIANTALAGQQKEKPRAWQDLQAQAAKVKAVTERFREHVSGPVVQAIWHKQSSMELLFDDYSIPRPIRTELANELDIWLAESRQLALEASSYAYAPDRDDSECQAWIAVFNDIYNRGDAIAKFLRQSKMTDAEFLDAVGKVEKELWSGGQLGAVIKACYMTKGATVYVDQNLKEQREKLEMESAPKSKDEL